MPPKGKKGKKGKQKSKAPAAKAPKSPLIAQYVREALGRNEWSELGSEMDLGDPDSEEEPYGLYETIVRGHWDDMLSLASQVHPTVYSLKESFFHHLLHLGRILDEEYGTRCEEKVGMTFKSARILTPPAQTPPPPKRTYAEAATQTPPPQENSGGVQEIADGEKVVPHHTL